MFNSVSGLFTLITQWKKNINVLHQTDTLPGQCLCKKMKNERKKKQQKKTTSAAEPGTGWKYTREPAAEKKRIRNDTPGTKVPQIFPGRPRWRRISGPPLLTAKSTKQKKAQSVCSTSTFLLQTDSSNHGNRETWVRRKNKKAERYVCEWDKVWQIQRDAVVVVLQRRPRTVNAQLDRSW